MTPCIWLGTTHPCNPPNYGLWVNLLFFMCIIHKHCFPPMLLVFAMKCCTKTPCPLPHNHYCCLLSSHICLPLWTCLISSPIACPDHLCYVDVYCVFFYFWYMLHFFVTPFWIVCVHIFVWLFKSCVGIFSLFWCWQCFWWSWFLWFLCLLRLNHECWWMWLITKICLTWSDAYVPH